MKGYTYYNIPTHCDVFIKTNRTRKTKEFALAVYNAIQNTTNIDDKSLGYFMHDLKPATMPLKKSSIYDNIAWLDISGDGFGGTGTTPMPSEDLLNYKKGGIIYLEID